MFHGYFEIWEHLLNVIQIVSAVIMGIMFHGYFEIWEYLFYVIQSVTAVVMFIIFHGYFEVWENLNIWLSLWGLLTVSDLT